VDSVGGLLNVRRTVSSSEIVEPAKTTRSRRQVPLSPRAIDAIDALPTRFDSPYLIPARRGGVCARRTSSAPGRDRTSDPLLRRQPLYPLSYGGSP
jgi:integrase